MKKYLITGGEGFIGEKIVKSVNGISFDIKSGNNILDTQKLFGITSSIEGIFHCAAKISVPESIQKPEEYYENNVLGTANVINLAERIKTKIVFSSSAAVYGEANSIVIEEMSLNPKSPYAQNKCEAEELLKKSSMPHVILRYFNVYGPGQSYEYAGVITTFIKKALKNEDLIIFGDGKQTRDFIYIDDVVGANLRAMDAHLNNTQVFNIGTGLGTTIIELAEKIINLSNSSSTIKIEPNRAGDILFSCANISKATLALQWEPAIYLDEGLKKTITFYRDK